MFLPSQRCEQNFGTDRAVGTAIAAAMLSRNARGAVLLMRAEERQPSSVSANVSALAKRSRLQLR